MGIRFVLVDLDRTLFPSLEFAKDARMTALRAMKKEGMKASVAKAYVELMKVVEEMGPNHADHFGELLARLGERKEGSAKIIAAGVFAYHRAKTRIKPFPEAGRALARMRREGLKLYVASEGRSVKQWDKILRMHVQEYFDGAFISEELGVEKGRKFYAKIARKLGVRPGEVLMIGDKMDRDVEPARKAGMRAIFLDRKKKTGGKKRDVAKNLLEAAEISIDSM
ncbi:Glyceraldehyde 3-phosphate phosphatase [Candidatus Burarchaeum australiense]|nr:Glyceraldehyde 3-phosphate phosphatase [Candidatus Burarchaeum australiense]